MASEEKMMNRLMETTNDSIQYNERVQRIVEPYMDSLLWLMYEIAESSCSGQEFTLNTALGRITFSVK